MRKLKETKANLAAAATAPNKHAADAIAAGNVNAEAVRQSEELFRELAENIREIFFVAGPAGSPIHYVSPAYEQITGQSCASLYQNARAWLKNIYPDDRPRVEQALRDHPENLDEEHRVVRADGALRWLRLRTFPVKDAVGAVSRVVGIAEDITESKRGREAEQTSHRILQALYGLSQKILNSLDLQTILEEFLNQAFSVGMFDIGNVRLLDAKAKVLRVAMTRGYADGASIEHPTIALTGQSAGVNLRQTTSLKETLVVENIHRAAGWGSFKREGVVSGMMLPIHTDEELLGVVQLGTRTQRSISSDEHSLIEALTSQAAIAIQKATLHEQTQRHLERIRALHEIDLAITSSLDLASLLAILLEKIELFVPITAASTVNLVSAESGALEPIVCRGMTVETWQTQERETAASWAKRVADTRASVAVLNIPAIPYNQDPEIYRRLGLSSYLGVPLIADRKVTGVLGLYSKEEHAFGNEEIEFLNTLAGQAAVAIQNAQLYESTKRQQNQLVEQERIQRILKELSQDITQMDVGALLEKLTRAIREVFQVDISDVRLRTGEKWAQVLISSGDLVQSLPESGESRRGATEWVVRNRKSIALDDYLEQKIFARGRVSSIFEVRGFLAAPLLARNGAVIGVIRALCKKPRTFTTREIELFEQLANGAAIAIENERLYLDLECSNKIKTEFLSVMSHELRTPLNIIMGYADLAVDYAAGAANEPCCHAAQKIKAQATELLEMINSIMDATRIESGTIPVTKQRVHLDALFDQLKTTYASARLKEVQLIWRLPERLPELTTDGEKLQRIMKNLIDNAIKFTESGTITVSVRADEATAGAPADAAHNTRGVEFAVEDTGIGIAAESLSSIFDIFKQVDSSATRDYGGVGVGLYIVKSFAELLGGQVSVRSEVGKGSTFMVRMPCDG